MVFNDATELYIPIVFCLVENRRAWTYWHFWHLVLVLTETKFRPSTITADFELALVQSIKEQFSDAKIVGCLFHYKQALRRKLKELKISDDEISVAMQTGNLDRLTLVKRDEIDDTIADLRLKLERGDREKWEKFWSYFGKTWLREFAFSTWNISELQEEDIEITNRTNNGLENFNKKLNNVFSSPHPNIFMFINAIKKISGEYDRLVKSTLSGHSQRPNRK
jgi:hypothetical protein